ncbi:unnamed protein product [Medioppia subpectinata]|uniref:RING-type E3 ubiquitin transferase n=1 Tax=Medioppia subpectinata TaxID=1979941 RepID=A0A7R9KC25_9ACAR|nr:unnamed protein product [Medioppia subpectinata]CAG2100337.1 unnamed protein product [Medioppia subpectinata]
MAEAAVDMSANISSLRYFCHQCSQESDSVLSDFTCPLCRSGFVEEVTHEDTAETNPDDNNESDTQMADILDDLYGQYSGSRRRGSTNGANSTSGGPQSDSAGRHHLRSHRYSPNDGNARRPTTSYFQLNLPRNAESGALDSSQSLEGLFQHILTNVASGQLASGREGAVNMGARGLINIDFPLPLFQVLHGNPGDYAWGEGGLNEIISQLLNQLDGSGPPPMAKEDIEKVPFVSISEEQVQKNLQCTVCMEDFKVTEKVRLLECSHCYHNDCIVPWLQMHATCPVCRKELTTSRTANRDPNLSTNTTNDPRVGGNSSTRETSGSSNTNTQSSNGTYESTDDYD